MAKVNEPCGELEWRISFLDGTWKQVCSGFVIGLSSKVWSTIQKAWRFGTSDPNKVIHCFKVGMALCLVSLFYYMRLLYEGVGGNAMWAVLTVVVTFEYTAGTTICKCLNRTTATLLAAALGIGVHWIANQFGEKFEPIILQASVFMLAAVATCSRFRQLVEAQYDHGALIFIITFILISVSGYHVEELLEMAHHRLSTVGIETSICILISMFFCPVWGGNELHNLIENNMEKLSDSLDECVAEYFRNDAYTNNTKIEASNDVLMGYTCVLNSMANDENLDANKRQMNLPHNSIPVLKGLKLQ